MIYNKFNQYIKDYFFPCKKKGDTILFCVDDGIISEFLNQENIEYEKFQRSLAEKLTFQWPKTNESYFGICAIQVFIVSQMQEEDDFSSNQYNPRLASFIGVDINALQKLYAAYQDDIWNSLKIFCKENEFRIVLPIARPGKGCYIQYPFSQAILNKEDLNNTPILFERLRIKQTQYFSFNEFSQLIENADNGHCLNTHYYRVKEKMKNEFGNIEQFYRQIYNYFIDEWNGSYPITYFPLSKTSPNKKILDIHIFINKSFESITVLDDEFVIIDETIIPGKNIFSFIEKHRKIYDDEFLIFKLDNTSGEGEYEQKFELGEKYVIICQPSSKASIFIDSLCKIDQRICETYSIYVTQPLKKKSKHHFWHKYFSQQAKGYKIEGGVKLAYKSWMKGCGPILTCEEKTVIWINGNKYENSEIDCTNFAIGTYKILKDTSIEKFEIQTPLNARTGDCAGWKIDKQSWNPVNEDFQLSGLIHKFNENTNTSNIADWLNLATSKGIKKDYSSTVLKAIKRSNYGIR